MNDELEMGDGIELMAFVLLDDARAALEAALEAVVGGRGCDAEAARARVAYWARLNRVMKIYMLDGVEWDFVGSDAGVGGNSDE